VDDIFLLRRSNYIAATPSSTTRNELANNPAFVALLHGTLGQVQPVFTGNITAFQQTITRTSAGSFLADGVLAGQRIRLSNAGVFSGDYTVTAVSATTITIAEFMPAGVSLTVDQIPTAPVSLSGVTIGVTRNDVTTADPNAQASDRTQWVERINYDTAINGRLIVNGLGGNDWFASDDNSAITTLDGGAGNDTFQIGQIYGLQRDALTCTPGQIDDLRRDTSCGNLNPQDVFGTVATTRGWLSAGNTSPLTVVGDIGNDVITVYSNHAALRLEGNEGNDLFTVRAFALAETRTNGGSPTGTACTPSASRSSQRSLIMCSG
jgi:hypothetical protein